MEADLHLLACEIDIQSLISSAPLPKIVAILQKHASNQT